MSIFPILQPITSGTPVDNALPMAREPAWDFEQDKPIFVGGEPLMVTGLPAVRVWALNALYTVRRRWPALSPNYGNDAAALIGSGFSEELKKAEAGRYITECLISSPYIKSVDVTEISFNEDTLSAKISFMSVYGEVSMDV